MSRTGLREKCAFTIVELLVVITIIALLATLLTPSLNGISHVAKKTMCASNLKRVGEAYTLLSGSDTCGRDVKVIPTKWPMQLAKFAGDGGVFVCPEAEAQLQTPETLPLYELACVNVTTTGYDLEYIEGPFTAKLSDEQFKAATFRECTTFNAPAYKSGADPTVFWYIQEDITTSSSDMDYEIGTRVSENGDGSLTLRLTMVTGAGYNFDLVDKPDRSVLLQKSQMNGGPGSEVVLSGGGGATSYGMNAEVNTISNSAGKILVMDYPWFVARSTHDWSGKKLASNIPGIPAFARHHGKINVLFTDCSVRLKSADEVNPADPGVQRTFWDAD